jgi:NADPH:quinone reductase-like Zn-dependent oxidoreductase
MKAVRILEHGGPEVLLLEDAPRPSAGPGELLLQVHAAAVNPVDTGIRRSGMMGTQLPYIPGFDVSGVVVEVGGGVAGFEVGDEVFAMLDLRRGGGYAEYTVVKDTEATQKPAGVSHVEAAAVPLVALTAWQVLFDTADLQAGQTILIHAAAGGVGSVAVQLAKWKGARVIGTASESNHVFLRELGADEVIDYRTQRFEEVVSDADVVLDAVGGDTAARSLEVLKPGGICVSIAGGVPPGRPEELGVRFARILVHPDSDQLARIADLIDEGHVRPIVTHVFAPEEASEAHRQSETRHTRGKIVLRFDTDGR